MLHVIYCRYLFNIVTTKPLPLDEEVGMKIVIIEVIAVWCLAGWNHPVELLSPDEFFSCSIFHMLCSERPQTEQVFLSSPIPRTNSQSFAQWMLIPSLVPQLQQSLVSSVLLPVAASDPPAESLRSSALLGWRRFEIALMRASVKEFQKPKLPILLVTAVIYVQKYCVKWYSDKVFYLVL